jgi:hypothetical protein
MLSSRHVSFSYSKTAHKSPNITESLKVAKTWVKPEFAYANCSTHTTIVNGQSVKMIPVTSGSPRGSSTRVYDLRRGMYVKTIGVSAPTFLSSCDCIAKLLFECPKHYREREQMHTS